MTTFTTEDRINASPPHIVDSGASVKTLAETCVEMLLEEVNNLQKENAKLRREVENLMDGRC